MNTTSIITLPAVAALFAFSGFTTLSHAAEKPAKKETSDTAAGASKVAAADQKFVKAAAASGMAEVKLGELAQEKAGKQEVKDFGAMMATDHGKANEELTALAASKEITLPEELDAAHQAKLNKLSKLDGDAFDKAYVTEMVASHKKAVSLFENASKSLKDDELKAFAEKTLPTLKTHLEHAQGLHGW